MTSSGTVSRPTSDYGTSAPGSTIRLRILDGWRALSILAVIAGHWIPLGPSAWNINAASAASGMAIFFCLSGFLITKLLYSDPSIRSFLIKRVFRIVPLSWLAMSILAIANYADSSTIAANFGFYANLPPAKLMEGGQHLWSLCVEVQFYLFAALAVALAGRNGLYLLPVLAIVITALRVLDDQVISIVTWHRVDEILAGACAALVWIHFPPSRLISVPKWLSPVALIILLGVSLPQAGELGFFRPYMAAVAVAASLYSFPTGLYGVWTSKAARYVAEISYALYVWHVILQATPLGGDGSEKSTKYLLRIPLAIATWTLSHLSTRYFEMPLTKLGRRLLSK